jgi:hypothetical protein
MLEISLACPIFTTSDESVILSPPFARLVRLQEWSRLTCQASTGNALPSVLGKQSRRLTISPAPSVTHSSS